MNIKINHKSYNRQKNFGIQLVNKFIWHFSIEQALQKLAHASSIRHQRCRTERRHQCRGVEILCTQTLINGLITLKHWTFIMLDALLHASATWAHACNGTCGDSKYRNFGLPKFLLPVAASSSSQLFFSSYLFAAEKIFTINLQPFFSIFSLLYSSIFIWFFNLFHFITRYV